MPSGKFSGQTGYGRTEQDLWTTISTERSGSPLPREGNNATQRTARLPPCQFLMQHCSEILSCISVLIGISLFLLFASSANSAFAIFAARRLYTVYPPLVAAVILGGIGGLICYIPSILAILSFLWIFNIDIRYPSQSRSSIRSWAGVVRSLLRDEASAARLGIVLGPMYVLLLGRTYPPRVEVRALDAATGGQLASTLLNMRILFAWAAELWKYLEADRRSNSHT